MSDNLQIYIHGNEKEFFFDFSEDISLNINTYNCAIDSGNRNFYFKSEHGLNSVQFLGDDKSPILKEHPLKKSGFYFIDVKDEIEYLGYTIKLIKAGSITYESPSDLPDIPNLKTKKEKPKKKIKKKVKKLPFADKVKGKNIIQTAKSKGRRISFESKLLVGIIPRLLSALNTAALSYMVYPYMDFSQSEMMIKKYLLIINQELVKRNLLEVPLELVKLVIIYLGVEFISHLLFSVNVFQFFSLCTTKGNFITKRLKSIIRLLLLPFSVIPLMDLPIVLGRKSFKEFISFAPINYRSKSAKYLSIPFLLIFLVLQVALPHILTLNKKSIDKDYIVTKSSEMSFQQIDNIQIENSLIGDATQIKHAIYKGNTIFSPTSGKFIRVNYVRSLPYSELTKALEYIPFAKNHFPFFYAYYLTNGEKNKKFFSEVAGIFNTLTCLHTKIEKFKPCNPLFTTFAYLNYDRFIDFKVDHASNYSDRVISFIGQDKIIIYSLENGGVAQYEVQTNISNINNLHKRLFWGKSKEVATENLDLLKKSLTQVTELKSNDKLLKFLRNDLKDIASSLQKLSSDKHQIFTKELAEFF